jgi:hypothetical protein
MARLTPILTSLKTLGVTLPTPLETLLATPEELPTAEPATAQISYTVQNANLPVFSFDVYRVVWVGYLVGAGKINTAGYVYYRMKKNGASVATGSTYVSAGYYYTFNCWFYDVKVGDLLELALWSSVSGNNWDYKAFCIHPTRLIPFNKPRLLTPCNFSALTQYPILSLGNPSYTLVGVYVNHLDSSIALITSSKLFEALYPKDTYGLTRLYYGDLYNANSATSATDTTFRPKYYRQYTPNPIIMRGLKTDGQL